MTTHEEKRAKRRLFVRRNLFWLFPLGAVVGTGLFIGFGFLVAWLWRVTLGDIFGLKAISFWQAWGLILLSQILFKANMQRSVAAGRMHRRHCEPSADPAAGPGGAALGT